MLETYTVDIITKDEVTKKALPHILKAFRVSRINFYENLPKVMRQNRANPSQKNIIMIDMPYNLNELRFYLDKLEHKIIFLLKHNYLVKVSSIEECLMAFQDIRQKIFQANNGGQEFLLKSCALPEDHSKKALIVEGGAPPHVEGDDHEFFAVDLEYLEKMDIHIHHVSKPFTIKNMCNTLIEAIPGFIEKIEYEIQENLEK